MTRNMFASLTNDFVLWFLIGLKTKRDKIHAAPNGAINGDEHSIAINITSLAGLSRQHLKLA